MREATNGEYPKYAVWENVPGAFSSNKGWDFHAVLEALCSVCDSTVSIPKPYDAKRANQLVWSGAGEIVGDNYSIAWRTLDAQYWRVPQRRKRIYLVADFGSQRAGEILFKPDSLRGDLQTGNEAGQGASADAVGSVDGGIRTVGVDTLTPWDSQGNQVHNGVGNCVYPCMRHQGGGGSQMGYVLAPKGSVDGSVRVECVETVTLASSAKNAEIAYNISPCLMARAGTGGNQLPLTVYSFDSLSSNSMKSSNPFSGCRAGKTDASVVVLNDQGGSSINVESEETSPTLRANSHQHEPVISFKPGAMVRDMGNRIWEEQSPTLRANMGDNQPAVCYGIDQQGGKGGANYSENTMPPMCSDSHGTPHAVCYDARGNGDGETACTITGDHQNRIKDYTAVAVQETYQNNTGPLMANSHPGSYTGQDAYSDMLVAGKAPETLCFDETQITSPTNGNNPQWNEPSHPLASTARPPTVICKKPPRKYIIRRLTPTECARLQGFPDWWSTLAPYNPADAEFWEDVRKTHAEINGKKYKPVKDIKKWYNKLHTDSAEYKMWGNGIALPNAEYVLHGIAKQGAKTLGSLFDGSGGFPLAGVLNGITPLWASEVEPYAIAVTKYHFE